MDDLHGALPVTAAPASIAIPVPELGGRAGPAAGGPIKVAARGLRIRYGDKVAVRDVDLDIPENSVMSFIGPSGCGKSTILRCFDRMNDLIPGAVVEGQIGRA